MQSTERVLTVDCQFECSSLVWTSLLLSPPAVPEGGPTPQDPDPEKGFLEFCCGLQRVPGVSPSDKPRSPLGVLPDLEVRASFWCKAWAFPAVLQAAMLFCGGALEGEPGA